MRSHRAFTLLELLIGMGILLVLIGLLVPAVASVRRRKSRLPWHSFAATRRGISPAKLST